jgi:putative endonuclease
LSDISVSVTKPTGDAAEAIAERFLQAQGLTTIARNYRCRGGEIDLIMRDRDSVVFVEVRLRRSSAFGGAGASIGVAKQRRLILAAQHYLLTLNATPPCRFDAILMNSLEMRDVEWIRNAFST